MVELKQNNRKKKFSKVFVLFGTGKNYLFAFVKLLVFFVFTLLLLLPYLFAKLSKGVVPVGVDFYLRSIWSRFGLWLCNIQVEVSGQITEKSDVYACNHVSWLDILTLQSLLNISFVAKSEVKKWPGFGFLAKIADTVFIDRRAIAVKSQQKELLKALNIGRQLCLFPEGTSTDGSHILPFKSSLFEVFVSFNKCDSSSILVQPVSLVYTNKDPKNPTIFGWWGEMNLLSHIFDVVANVKSGNVKVSFEDPVDAKKIGNRKKLALEVEKAIRKCF